MAARSRTWPPSASASACATCSRSRRPVPPISSVRATRSWPVCTAGTPRSGRLHRRRPRRAGGARACRLRGARAQSAPTRRRTIGAIVRLLIRAPADEQQARRYARRSPAARRELLLRHAPCCPLASVRRCSRSTPSPGASTTSATGRCRQSASWSSSRRRPVAQPAAGRRSGARRRARSREPLSASASSFLDLIEGVRMDVEGVSYEVFDELVVTAVASPARSAPVRCGLRQR